MYPFLLPGLPEPELAQMLPDPTVSPDAEPRGPHGEPMICVSGRILYSPC